MQIVIPSGDLTKKQRRRGTDLGLSNMSCLLSASVKWREWGRARHWAETIDEDKGDKALPVTSWINSFSPLARTRLLCSNIIPQTCCHTHIHIFFFSLSYRLGLSVSLCNFCTFALSLSKRAWRRPRRVGVGVMMSITMIAPVYNNNTCLPWSLFSTQKALCESLVTLQVNWFAHCWAHEHAHTLEQQRSAAVKQLTRFLSPIRLREWHQICLCLYSKFVFLLPCMCLGIFQFVS